jgi:DNA-binding transcriptional LysR family regulator
VTARYGPVHPSSRPTVQLHFWSRSSRPTPSFTVEQLCRYPRISPARARAGTLLDDALEQIGRSRRVIAVVPTYAVASLLALEDDVIALVPRVLARHLLDRQVPVRWHELPLELPGVTVHLRWHRRLDGDRPSRWLRDHVAASLQHTG